MAADPECFLILNTGGQRWPCESGAYIGRAGTVATDVLSSVHTLSRRHLKVELADGAWYATALPDSRNPTWIDGQEMRRGLRYPLRQGLQAFQVDRFEFFLSVASGDMTVAGWESTPEAVPDAGENATMVGWVRRQPPPANPPAQPLPEPLAPSPQAYPQSFTEEGYGDYDAGLPDFPVDETVPEPVVFPGAVVELDHGFNIRSANERALMLMGKSYDEVVGRDFVSWAREDERIRLRSWLHDQAGGRFSSLTVRVSLDPGRGKVREWELEASGAPSRYLVLIRDVSRTAAEGRDRGSRLQQMEKQTGVLAELARSKAFQQGDLARGLSLLTVKGGETLTCRSAAVWLRREGGLQISREENGDGKATAPAAGKPGSAGSAAAKSLPPELRITEILRILSPQHSTGTAGTEPEALTVFHLADTAKASLKLTCQARHSPEAGSAPPAAEVNLLYCRVYFESACGDARYAVAREGEAVFRVLKDIGFISAGSASVLTVVLQHGDVFYGLMSFERGPAVGTAAAVEWSQSDIDFAFCLASLCLQTVQSREGREAFQKLRQREKMIAAELDEASRYVHRVLPAPIKAGPIRTEWIIQPSEELGGDAFGYQWIDDNLFALYILDVVGHGTGAALLSVSVLNTLRSRLLVAEEGVTDPSRVLASLNSAFQMESQGEQTFSLWYGIFDRRTRRMTYASGGHPPALLLLPETGANMEDFAALGTEGITLGGIDNIEYPSESTVVPPGSKLYLFTDGAFEIPLLGEREWSFDEFTAVVRTTAPMASGETEYIRKRVASLCALPHFPDDFTVVRFQFD